MRIIAMEQLKVVKGEIKVKRYLKYAIHPLDAEQEQS